MASTSPNPLTPPGTCWSQGPPSLLQPSRKEEGGSQGWQGSEEDGAQSGLTAGPSPEPGLREAGQGIHSHTHPRLVPGRPTARTTTVTHADQGPKPGRPSRPGLSSVPEAQGASQLRTPHLHPHPGHCAHGGCVAAAAHVGGTWSEGAGAGNMQGVSLPRGWAPSPWPVSAWSPPKPGEGQSVCAGRGTGMLCVCQASSRCFLGVGGCVLSFVSMCDPVCLCLGLHGDRGELASLVQGVRCGEADGYICVCAYVSMHLYACVHSCTRGVLRASVHTCVWLYVASQHWAVCHVGTPDTPRRVAVRAGWMACVWCSFCESECILLVGCWCVYI